MFFKGSRYAGVKDLVFTTPDGREIKYKKTRFTPPTPAILGHLVHEGERLDLIADRYFRDSERFWRIADANQVLWPDDLTAQAGRVILVPAAEG
jgi:hypothetical protein